MRCASRRGGEAGCAARWSPTTDVAVADAWRRELPPNSPCCSRFGRRSRLGPVRCATTIASCLVQHGRISAPVAPRIQPASLGFNDQARPPGAAGLIGPGREPWGTKGRLGNVGDSSWAARGQTTSGTGGPPRGGDPPVGGVRGPIFWGGKRASVAWRRVLGPEGGGVRVGGSFTFAPRPRARLAAPGRLTTPATASNSFAKKGLAHGRLRHIVKPMA